MQPREIDRLVGVLERDRRIFPRPITVEQTLTALERVAFRDAAALARFHDALLFLRAYPDRPSILKRAESLLQRFGGRVAALERTGDLAPLLDPEVSGIAGTTVEVVFSYDFLRWLVRRFPGQLDIDWSEEPDEERLASLLTPMIPLLDEAGVDANVSYRASLEAAGGLGWILRSVEQLAIPPAARAALYDSLGLRVRWKLGNSPMTRTRMRRLARATFYQDGPLVARRDVSLARELAKGPMRTTKLSRKGGESALDMARAAMATRYRELYGFTWGDPGTILSADGGRGLEILLVGLIAEKRLPLRAGFAPFILRNGVPIGYGDAFALGERMEVSFNIFPAFRDGESAFCLARLLALYHQLFGSTSFSIDPFQIGEGNDEAIEAGAFWFYRKLGFRSSDPLVERLARRETQRMAARPEHRTAARTLRKMARSPLYYEMPPSRAGDWDGFCVRNIGLAVERRFAALGGDAAAFRAACLDRVAAALLVRRGSLSPRQQSSLEALAPVLALIPDLGRWSDEERAGVREIVCAKAGRTEEKYVRLLAGHDRLRQALRKLGSARGRPA